MINEEKRAREGAGQVTEGPARNRRGAVGWARVRARGAAAALLPAVEMLLGVVVGMGVALSGSRAMAATNYDIKTTANTGCTLAKAIMAVNNHNVTIPGCAKATGTFNSPDTIHLANGLTFLFSSTLTISGSVTLSSWDFTKKASSLNRVVFKQNGGFSGEGGMLLLSTPDAPATTNVTFNDIDFLGTDTINAAIR
jgi:hypothetical protein